MLKKLVRMMDHRPVVLLGASNLTIGWSSVLSSLTSIVDEPIDLRVALGMGRSYVDWSRFWFRRLPGIVQSGLWSSLPQVNSAPPLAMLTDIGNDIVYERSAEQIFPVIQDCVSRLRQWNPDARIVMTGLPLESVASLGPVRFRIARAILFPGCNLSFSTILSNTERLNSLCRQFAVSEQVAFVEPEREWYGVDPIHVIPAHRERAFLKFFSAWGVPPAVGSPSKRPAGSTRCELPTSHERTVFGLHRVVAQPVVDRPDLRVSAY